MTPPAPRTVPEPIAARGGDSAIQLIETAVTRAREAIREQRPVLVAEVRPRTVDIAPDAEFNGELLRQVRQSRGISIEQISEHTRILQRHLENVEADRYDQLPTTVYLRGILMNIARELGLDGLRVCRSYLGLVAANRQKKGPAK